MDRLTRSQPYLTAKDFLCYNCNGICSGCLIKEMIKKLQRYEDAEENKSIDMQGG